MFIPVHDANKLRHVDAQYVTLGLIAVNLLVFFLTGVGEATNVQQASSIYYSYGYVPAVINDFADLPPELAILPEAASYVTYTFLHANFMHVAGNMLFLWVFGDNVEDAMGHFRFLVFYFLCGAAGAFAHGLAVPQSQAPLIGASGATAGIVGAYLLLHPRVKIWILALGRIPLRLRAVWVLGGWIIFQIGSFLAFDESEISWAAHLGGIIAGMVFILFMRRTGVSLFDQDLPDVAVSVPNVTRQDRDAQKPETSRQWGRPEE